MTGKWVTTTAGDNGGLFVGLQVGKVRVRASSLQSNVRYDKSVPLLVECGDNNEQVQYALSLPVIGSHSRYIPAPCP